MVSTTPFQLTILLPNGYFTAGRILQIFQRTAARVNAKFLKLTPDAPTDRAQPPGTGAVSEPGGVACRAGLDVDIFRHNRFSRHQVNQVNQVNDQLISYATTCGPNTYRAAAGAQGRNGSAGVKEANKGSQHEPDSQVDCGMRCNADPVDQPLGSALEQFGAPTAADAVKWRRVVNRPGFTLSLP